MPPPTPEPPAPPLLTGALRLDMACGGGIFPGEVVEICGPPESGKTTLCLRLAAEAFLSGGECAWIDADWSFDPVYAKTFGIFSSRRSDDTAFVLARPVDAESALGMLHCLAAAGPRLVVFDSLTSLVCRQETAGSPDGEEYLETKLLSLVLRSITPALQRRGTILVFVRQTPSDAAAAGSALSAAYHGLGRSLERLSLDLHAHLSVRLERARSVEIGGETTGLHVVARVIRPRLQSINNNSIKIAPCLQRVDFDIMYKQGLIRTGEVFDLGIETGSILLREGRYFFQNQELGLGRAAAIREMDRQALTRQVEQVIRQKMLRNSVIEHR